MAQYTVFQREISLPRGTISRLLETALRAVAASQTGNDEDALKARSELERLVSALPESAELLRLALDPQTAGDEPVNPELLQPEVTAEVHSDDWRRSVPGFSATAWFATASDQDIIDLIDEGCGGNQTADSVAEACEDEHDGIADLFAYTRGGSCGFECHVSEPEAIAWLRRHRPHLAAYAEEGGTAIETPQGRFNIAIYQGPDAYEGEVIRNEETVGEAAGPTAIAVYEKLKDTYVLSVDAPAA